MDWSVVQIVFTRTIPKNMMQTVSGSNILSCIVLVRRLVLFLCADRLMRLILRRNDSAMNREAAVRVQRFRDHPSAKPVSFCLLVCQISHGTLHGTRAWSLGAVDVITLGIRCRFFSFIITPY